MFKGLFTLSSVAILLTACSSAPAIIDAHDPKQVDTSIPAIGIETTTNIGEQMLAQGQYGNYDVIELKQNVNFSALMVPKVSGTYVKAATVDGYDLFGPIGKAWSDLIGAESFWLSLDRKEICTSKNYGCIPLSSVNHDYQRDVSLLVPDALQQTLLYNGKVGSVITIGYREFMDNNARAAFSNEVKYDLSESSMIRYKGAIIEVIDSTSGSITYKVIENFE